MTSLQKIPWNKLSIASLLTISGIVLLNIPIFGYYKYSTFDYLFRYPIYIIGLVGWYICRPLLAINQWYRDNKKEGNHHNRQSVSVLIPAYNESHGIVETVESVLKQSYSGPIEIVITDDGSTDNTWEVINWLAATYESVHTVRQENAGPGVARNTSLAHATGELVLSLDADTVLDFNTIRNMVKQFDNDVVAVGGNVNVNNDTGVLTKTQLFDYSLSFSIGRMFQSRLNHVLCLSGSCSMFRRAVLDEVGGWKIDPKYADDFELSIRMSEQGQIGFAQDAIAHTEAPTTIQGLWKQRTWWARLGLSTMILHWRSNLNPSYGAMGLIGLPLKTALMIGAVFQIGQLIHDIATGSQLTTTIAAVIVFGIISTTAFSLIMVALMVLILNNKKPLQYIPYLIVYFTVYRAFHTMARLVGIMQAIKREFKDLLTKLIID
ncbi:glycosyltransferase [Halocatena halophila]|uniref:glycosyltransferase n=1 Tax=Halocatena halophila TaxID=2814576 RepID=UPI002ED1609B